MKNLAKVNYRGFIVPVVVGVLLWLLTAVRPTGISVSGWHLFAIFLATIIACITKPLPIVGVAIISYVLILLTGLVKMKFALTAFADSTPWMIAMAYMIARGFVKTGLGRRIALIFVRNFGKKTLGLGYSLSLIDLLVAPATPAIQHGQVVLYYQLFNLYPRLLAQRLGMVQKRKLAHIWFIMNFMPIQFHLLFL